MNTYSIVNKWYSISLMFHQSSKNKVTKLKKARCSKGSFHPLLWITPSKAQTYMPELRHSGLGAPQTFNCGSLRRSCSARFQVKSRNVLLCGPPTLSSGSSQPQFSFKHLRLQQKSGTLNRHMKDDNSKLQKMHIIIKL